MVRGKSKGLNQLVDSIYEEGELVVSDDQEVEIRETSCVGNLNVVVNDFEESEEESGEDGSGKMDFELKDSEEKNVQQILGVCTKKESNELNCTLKVLEIHETEGVKIGELAKQSTMRGYCQSWHGLFTNKKSLGILQYHEPSIVYGKIIVRFQNI